MSDQPTLPESTLYSGVLLSLSAAEAENLNERGVPKKLGRLSRKATISGYDKDARTVTMAVSSETPVERYFGEEILSHAKGAIRMDRLTNGCALLFNHDMDLHLGRSVGSQLKDNILYVTCRFGSNPLALEKERDVADDILVDVSIGYVIHEVEITEDPKTGFRSYLVTDWELLEVSLVTVPADPTVGVGRSSEEMPLKVRSFRTLEPEPETRKAEPEEDKEDEDDPDDEDDDATGSESERSVTDPVTPTPTPTPEVRTTTMAASAGPDLAALNQERITGLRALRAERPDFFTESELMDAVVGTTTVAEARSKVADKVIAGAERTKVATVSDEVLGRMSERETKAYSLRNAYAYALNKRFPGSINDKGAEAGFEREVSQDLRKGAEERGFREFRGDSLILPGFLPPTQRTISAGSVGGSNVGPNSIVPVIQPGLIELLRSRTIAFALGAKLMSGLFGTPRFLRQTGTAQSSWLAEMSGVSPTDIAIDFFGMSPKRLSIMNQYTLEVLAQSPVAIEDTLRDDRNANLAISLDAAIIAGPGSANVPLGLMNYPGIAAILTGSTKNGNSFTAGAGNAPATFIDCNLFEEAISTANGAIGTMGWATTNRVRADLRTTQKQPGVASDFLLPDSTPDPNGVQKGPLGYNMVATSAPYMYTVTPANGGTPASRVDNLILGVWDQLMVGDWGLNELIIDNITGAQQALYKITEHALYDVALKHTNCFAISNSVATY